MPLTGVALTGSSPVTFMEMLGLLDKVHVVDPQTIHSPCLQKLEEEDSSMGQGDSGDHETNWTKLITDHPTVTGVFGSRGLDNIARARHVIETLFKPSFIE